MLCQESGKAENKGIRRLRVEQHHKVDELLDLRPFDNESRKSLADRGIISAHRVKLIELILPQQRFQSAAVHLAFIDSRQDRREVGVGFEIHHHLGDALTGKYPVIVMLRQKSAVFCPRFRQDSKGCRRHHHSPPVSRSHD